MWISSFNCQCVDFNQPCLFKGLSRDDEAGQTIGILLKHIYFQSKLCVAYSPKCPVCIAKLSVRSWEVIELRELMRRPDLSNSRWGPGPFWVMGPGTWWAMLGSRTDRIGGSQPPTYHYFFALHKI